MPPKHAAHSFKHSSLPIAAFDINNMLRRHLGPSNKGCKATALPSSISNFARAPMALVVGRRCCGVYADTPAISYLPRGASLRAPSVWLQASGSELGLERSCKIIQIQEKETSGLEPRVLSFAGIVFPGLGNESRARSFWPRASGRVSIGALYELASGKVLLHRSAS